MSSYNQEIPTMLKATYSGKELDGYSAVREQQNEMSDIGGPQKRPIYSSPD